MKIGIIGPTEDEILPLIHKLTNKVLAEHAMVTFHSGTYHSIPIVAAFSGVCKVNAAITAQTLIDKYAVDNIILTGVAGALDHNLFPCETVIADEIAYHDVAKGILTEYHPWMKDIYFRPDEKLFSDLLEACRASHIERKLHVGRLITGEAFITEKERAALIEAFKPQCVDMESAAVAHVCYANRIPFIVIRSISDYADENGTESFEANSEKAALNSLEVVEALIHYYANLGV